MSDVNATNQSPQPVSPLQQPPHAISFVIDGKVQETVYTQDRFAALLLSEPTIVNSTGVNVVIGQTAYDPETETFTAPDGSVAKAAPVPFASTVI